MLRLTFAADSIADDVARLFLAYQTGWYSSSFLGSLPGFQTVTK